MGQLERLRGQLRESRESIRTILDQADAEGRDLTDAEGERVDSLADAVERAENRIASVALADDDEDDLSPGERAHVREGRRRIAAGGSSRRSRPMGQAPAIHVDKSKRSYSFLKAIADTAEYGHPVGLEGELSTELRSRTSRTVPANLWLPLGVDPEIRAAMYPRTWRRDGSRRDLTTSTGTGGIFTVPELPLIDLLRAKLVLARAGATWLTDLQGPIGIPRQNSAGSVNWIGEGVAATPSNPTLDAVPLAPHTAISLENISYMFRVQTSVDADELVKNDLAAIMARGIDAAGLNGPGGAAPTGLLQNAAVQARSAALALGANGGQPSYPGLVAMFAALAGANADRGALGYVTNPAVQGYLLTTPKIAGSVVPMFVWEDPASPEADGKIGAFPAYTTTQVPSTLTKGTSAAVCSAILFGNWKDLLVGVWDDAVGFLVNPFTGQASGQVTISMSMAVDVNVRHPESFAIVTDALTA
jgi:HK97 family phage major capsid protein